MKAIACILLLFGVVCFLCPTITAQEAVQIVKQNGRSFEYVTGNTFENILKNETIKDRYVAVVSIVGEKQSGKSFLLNLFLNYLRTTYETWSPFTSVTYGSDWKSINVTSGFNSCSNASGITKGIWAWPEIFLHDDITYNATSGNKVAIIVLDTEGLLDVNKDIHHDTMIFSLSTMFSSMLGYNVDGDVDGGTLQFIDIFSTYTVYGSNLRANTSTQSTEAPFQNFWFIVRDTKYRQENETEFLKRIFSNSTNDQNKEMKKRIQSVYQKLGAFKLRSPGEQVAEDTFNGSTALIDQRFKDAVETVVTGVLAPENIVIKEIDGKPVKANDLSHFLETFTELVNKNITVATSLVEVLAYGSNYMLYEESVNDYDGRMNKSFKAVTETPTPYFVQAKLNETHIKHKNEVMTQFKNRVKLGGDALAVPFEGKLNSTIEEHFLNFNNTNAIMFSEYLKGYKASSKFGQVQMWVLFGLIGAVIVFAVVQTLRNKKSPEAENPNHMKDASKSITKT